MAGLAAVGFDYASLDKEVAKKLQNHAIHLRSALGRWGEAGKGVGEIICSAHEELAGKGRDGKFKSWVEAQGLSIQHAYDLMYVFERSKKYPVIMSFPPTVAYLLSAPSVSDAAIKEFEKQTDKGVKPTVASAKETIERFKISEKGKPGGVAASSDTRPASSDPVTGEAADSSGEDERTETQGNEAQGTDPRPPRSGKDKPGTGKCPNCAGTKWDEDWAEDDALKGTVFSCAKCHHPWGEPVDRQPEEKDHVGTMRSKTVKTLEAAMRAFDDLNRLCPKAGTHKQSIELCKTLLKSAQSWK
jgi:hypothetical protein